MLEELAEIDGALQQAIRTGFTWPADRPLPAFAWSEHRAVMARHLPLPSWRWVGAAYTSANEANWRVVQFQRDAVYAHRKAIKEFPELFSESDDVERAAVQFGDKEWLREPFKTVRHAMAELDNLIGPQAGVFTYTGRGPSIQDLESELFGDAAEGLGSD